MTKLKSEKVAVNIENKKGKKVEDKKILKSSDANKKNKKEEINKKISNKKVEDKKILKSSDENKKAKKEEINKKISNKKAENKKNKKEKSSKNYYVDYKKKIDDESEDEIYEFDDNELELSAPKSKKELERDSFSENIEELEVEEKTDDDKFDEEAANKFIEEDGLISDDNIYEGVSLDDPVRMYLKEIGQYNLLKQEQEQELAKQKQEAQDLLRKKKLVEKLPLDEKYFSKFTENELKIIKRGNVANKRLVESNLRLVVSIAKKYIGHGLSLLDLINEGNLGLMRGIEKFDYKLGFKLSTYVTWWIRQAVSRALADQSKTIRIPVHMVETINRMSKIIKKLTAELGVEPTTEQIAKKMKQPVEKIDEYRQIAQDPISLDKPVGEEDDSIVADFIADQNVISPEEYAEKVMLKEQIKDLLSTLKERERKVLVLRFGIDDDRPRTLEEVGKELNVTRERIRQIEDKALRKLKYRAKGLVQFIK